MKKLFMLFAVGFSLTAFAQVPNSTITAITKKFVMIDAKSDGNVVNVRYDSIKIRQLTMREAIMSYLEGSLLKSKEISSKLDEYRAGINGRPTEDDALKTEKYLQSILKIGDRQKVLMFEKLDKADDKKKILIHSKAVYYLKLDDDITDGNYRSDYYFTLKGIPIDDIYEYFLENIE